MLNVFVQFSSTGTIEHCTFGSLNEEYIYVLCNGINVEESQD